MPERVQLRRTKGWRKPDGTIVVARPSKFGNPYSMAEMAEHYPEASERRLAEMVVSDFRGLVEGRWDGLDDTPDYPCRDEIIVALRGHDLACWCPLEDGSGRPFPCHATVLLELANG